MAWITQTQMAKALGITRRAVAMAIAKGMPMSSVSAATKWRAANMNFRMARNTTNVPPPPPPVEDMPPLDAAIAASKTKPADSVEQARTNYHDALARERWAQKTAEKLLPSSNDDARKWAAFAQTITARIPILRKELIRLEKETGNLLDAAEVVAETSAHMSKLRAIVDSWPSALAAKVNPADPELARMQLEGARDQLLRAMSAK